VKRRGPRTRPATDKEADKGNHHVLAVSSLAMSASHNGRRIVKQIHLSTWLPTLSTWLGRPSELIKS